MTNYIAPSPRTRVYIPGMTGATGHIVPYILSHQDAGQIRDLNAAVRFVACVRGNPAQEQERLTQSANYDGLFSQYDSVQWLNNEGILVLNGLPIEVVKTDDAMLAPAVKDEVGVVVDFTPMNDTNWTGHWLDDYGGKIKIGIKPQAFKDKDGQHWKGISPDQHPHVIPNINDHMLSLSTGLVSQASCTTGGAATVLKVLGEGISGFRILNGSKLMTLHGATTSNGATEVVHGPFTASTGAGKALSIVFGDTLPGISNLAASAVRAAWETPSMIEFSLIVESKKRLTYDKVHKLFVDAANSTSFRMMLGLYYQTGKKLPFSLFKREGRTSVLVADRSNLVVGEIACINGEGKYIYSIRMNKVFYDNVFGYVGNNLDLISAVINKLGHLPVSLSAIDKPRSQHILPRFDTGKLVGVPAGLLSAVQNNVHLEIQKIQQELDDGDGEL